MKRERNKEEQEKEEVHLIFYQFQLTVLLSLYTLVFLLSTVTPRFLDTVGGGK